MTEPISEEHKPLDSTTIYQPLGVSKRKGYWRSLNELANDKDFEKIVSDEFPRQARLLPDLSRRDFLKLLGASLALAGLTACVPQQVTKILPYTTPPEGLVPAKPIYYASSMVQDGYAKGVLIKTTMGRPIKVDGNPGHPASQGASDIFMQASLIELYDPDRPKKIMQGASPKSWQDFTGAISQTMAGLGQGAGLRLLSSTLTSPTLMDQFKTLLARYPQAKWLQFSPVERRNTLAGAQLAFGNAYDPVYNFAKADVILSLDCDFMFAEPGHLRYSQDFASRHQPISANGTMNRLYIVESSLSLTGSNADHRLAVKPSQVEAFARAVAGRLGISGNAPTGMALGQDWLDPLVADLQKAGKLALVVAGERQPAVVHAMAYAMNQALGSIGSTVSFIDPVIVSSTSSLGDLVQELDSGQVELLVILDGNPVYTAPADLDFSAAMKKARQSVYLGYYADETAVQSSWFVPEAHYMEMWGDARAYDGTASLVQPVIEPLYEGKSPHELLSALLGQPAANSYDLVQKYWQAQLKSDNFDRDWRTILSTGLVPNSATKPAATVPQVNSSAFTPTPPLPASSGLEMVFEPDDTIWDGRFTNNAWLQELPKPLTKLTWDNAALMNPQTAARLGVTDNDLVDIKLGGRSVQAPVLLQPGEPDDVVVVSLGYGRKSGGSVLEGTGFNAYTIRTSTAPWFAIDPQIGKTGQTYPLALTHEHWSMENRDLVREADLANFQANPKFAQDAVEKPPTLYGEDEYSGYAWGMSINLGSCIGCNACVVSCQAENNIPTVGKDQVQRSREMHWIRIDRYFKGTSANPGVSFQPVPCMHCEKAPCEPVCPVQATTHSAEGLNEMTYNRCVGTRYCSNNCPYKVRRFNFYKYVDESVVSLQAMRNPDVTVRSRGVMEKCTYCVQRINETRIQAEVEGRSIRDGEVKTACQAACPTNAITFGNINDPNSEVSKQKATPLNYGLLADLGTRPRTTYLAKVKNPNPLIKIPTTE